MIGKGKPRREPGRGYYLIGQKKNTPKVPREARHSNLEIRMPKKFVKPDEEGAVGYPTDPADEATLRKLGFVEEGYPKRMYRDGEEPCEVNGSEEERVLGKDWVVFDEALRKNGGFYRERFKAAVNNPAEQVRLYTEYHTLHPALAAADSWYKETAPQIPLLQSQAMFNLVSDRQAEDQERSAIEAKATETPVVANPTARIPSAGKRRDEGIEARDHLIATLKESCKSLKGIRRNKRIAQSLDEQKDMRPPDAWRVRTFVEATENTKIRRAFDRMVAKAQFKKVPTP